jgi:hypothetical protein
MGKGKSREEEVAYPIRQNLMPSLPCTTTPNPTQALTNDLILPQFSQALTSQCPRGRIESVGWASVLGDVGQFHPQYVRLAGVT